MKREAKANLARIVVYALEKENGKKKRRMAAAIPTYLTAQEQATLCCMEGKQRAKKGKRGEGEEQYRIQGKQMEEIAIELQGDDSMAFCFL